MKWFFSPLPGDQVETEITQRDQFNNDDVDISETIVRETIQNSLDAAVDEDQTVHVTFRWLDKSNGLSSPYVKGLFEGQLKHAKKAGLDIDSVDFKNPRALVIEDYGTTGLTGEVTSKDDGNFSDFWRRHGKSHKTGKSIGRWGLGKLVYSVTSEIGAFFGVTRRIGDESVFLMGQTVLNLRNVDGKRYPPHAFFADVENKEDYDTRFTVPIKDDDFVNKFLEQFGINRREDPGLSIIIPFPNREFDIKTMITVAIENYFYPLITSKLRLSFDDIELNAKNIRELAKKYATDRIPQIDILFDFIEEVFCAEKTQLLEMEKTWLDDKKLGEDDFIPATLDTIRRKFSDGDLVGLALPVTIKHKNGDESESQFSVYIKRPPELRKGLDLYVRGGLTLPKESKFVDRCALGAMIAEDYDICSFLGDAENAAHTMWTANAEKLKKNYRNTQTLITAIKKSVVQLYDLLADIKEEENEEALLDFFWFSQPNSGTTAKDPGKVVPVPPIERTPALINLHQVEDGFTLSNLDAFTESKLPHDLRVTMAYDCRGDSFAQYSDLDFKLGGTNGLKYTHSTGVKVISGKDNVLDLQISELPFKFTVRGFDINRDVAVDIKEVV